MKRVLLMMAACFVTVCLNGQETTDVTPSDAAKGTQRDFRQQLREGNRQYNAGKVAEAEKSYWRALDIDERSNITTFNLGNALYRQQKFEEAGREFEKAASETSDRMEKARAYHNLGNARLQQNKVKESIEAYKDALRNNPNDIDTKYNLSYAMNLLNQQESQEDNEGDEKPDPDGDQKQNQQNPDNDQNQDNQEQQNETLPQQISPEDAQRILDAIAQEEKELLEKLQKQERAGSRAKIEKNW